MLLLINLLLCLVYSIYQVGCDCGLRGLREINPAENNDAQYGEFPWTVAILEILETPQGPLNVYKCDGSLIHPSVVLTVAQCISDKQASTLKVRSGEWNVQSKDEILPHQDRQLSEYIIHEKYEKHGMLNDVALLYLEKPVQIAENVNVICLPPQNENFNLKRPCVASGFGKDLFATIEGKFPTIMQRVELSVVPRDKCLTKLRKTELGPNFKLNNSFICAGGESGKNTCKGVGGSPLVCPIPNTDNMYYQVGMISWAIGCGDSTPGVYVNVPLFRNWIEEKLQLKNLSTTSVV